MLPSKNGGGHKNSTLLAVGNALKGGAQSNLRLAKANVTAKQSVHRRGGFHIPLDFVDASQLVIRLVIFKATFKVCLQVNVGAKRSTGTSHTLCIKLNQFFCNILKGASNLASGLFPTVTAQFVKTDATLVTAADIF